MIILDEPTANLSVMATERLLETMLELKKHNVAQIIISHRLAGHLRGRRPGHGPQAGRHVGERYIRETNEHEILRLIVQGDAGLDEPVARRFA